MADLHRKRKFANDDYQQPYQKRFRLPPIVELSKTLCADLNTLGESVKKYVEDVEFMSLPIVSNFENEGIFRNAVLDTLLAITVEQPQKIPHIAGLIQVVNSKKSTVGKIIVEFFHQKAQEAIEQSQDKNFEPQAHETGPWNRLKLILRLLSSLSFIIKAESLIALYSQLIKLAIDLQAETPSKRNPLGEAIYYNTLISLPYLLLYQRDNKELVSSIRQIIETAKEFKVVSNPVTITKAFAGLADAPYESKDIISLVTVAVSNFFEGDIAQSLSIFSNFQADLNEQLANDEQHLLPQLSIPSIESLKSISGLDTGLGSVDGMWRTPRLTFEVYLPVDGIRTTPPTDSYIGLLVRDIATDIIEALEFNRKEVARQIITLDLFFTQGLFAPPGSNIDFIKDVHLKNTENGTSFSTWKIEDVAIETVLSLIFKLPTVSQPFAYFYTILVEACTNASQAIAPVMGRAIRFFYANLDSIDFELRLRYLDWLSVQLSNFNFTWKWREWERDSAKQFKSNYHPKISFIRSLISKELRLTNREKISSTLTDEFQKYLDISLYSDDELKQYYISLFGESKLENAGLEFGDDSLKFFFLRENVPLQSKVKDLIEGVHKDSGASGYTAIIDELKDLTTEFANAEKLLITLVFQTVAFVGNRSISHANKYIANTAVTLRALLGAKESEELPDASADNSKDTLERQEWAVEAILKYWNKDPQNGFLVLDILQSFNIISPLSKINYVLDDRGSKNLGLINVSAIESVYRTLATSVYTNDSREVLESTIRQLIEIVARTADATGISGAITVPNVDDEYDECNENLWKYHTALGFTKSVLRKYLDEYVPKTVYLKELIDNEIKHDHTKSVITDWVDELKDL